MIFLVRHGEAAAGWGEHPDPGLSELGHRQAQAVSARLVELGATSLISSPMQRCRETAAPFAGQLGTEASIVPAVSEIVTPEDVTDRVVWLRALMEGEWPDNMLIWCASAHAAIDALPDGCAVFSHFVAINAIVGQVTGQSDVLLFKPGHCSVTILSRNMQGKLEIKALGDEANTRIL